MNLTEKIIITDTNVITDLFNADLLEMFSLLNNVYILDIIKESEINSKTCNMELINKIKVIHAMTLHRSGSAAPHRKSSFIWSS